MKKEIYDKFNFNEDIELMQLNYSMQNRQPGNQNEDYLYSLANANKIENEENQNKKWM